MNKPRRLAAVFAAVAAFVSVTVITVSAPDAGGAPTGCSLAPTGGTITRPIGTRTYNLNVPAGLTGSAVPLLLSLHGNGEGVTIEESNSGWTPYAASRHFIVAYPAGTGTGLNWDYAQGSADVTFLRAVVADIAATWCVNPSRVHAAGYSNGAVMAERLACDASDVFASVAALAGSSPTYPTPTAPSGSPCTLTRPIAVGIFQGLFDPISSYVIGTMNRDEWIARNGCPATGTREPGVLLEAITYAPCTSGVEVDWRVYLQSHNWPIGTDQADIHDRMWGLFTRNPRP